MSKFLKISTHFIWILKRYQTQAFGKLYLKISAKIANVNVNFFKKSSRTVFNISNKGTKCSSKDLRLVRTKMHTPTFSVICRLVQRTGLISGLWRFLKQECVYILIIFSLLLNATCEKNCVCSWMNTSISQAMYSCAASLRKFLGQWIGFSNLNELSNMLWNIKISTRWKVHVEIYFSCNHNEMLSIVGFHSINSLVRSRWWI